MALPRRIWKSRKEDEGGNREGYFIVSLKKAFIVLFHGHLLPKSMPYDIDLLQK